MARQLNFKGGVRGVSEGSEGEKFRNLEPNQLWIGSIQIDDLIWWQYNFEWTEGCKGGEFIILLSEQIRTCGFTIYDLIWRQYSVMKKRRIILVPFFFSAQLYLIAQLILILAQWFPHVLKTIRTEIYTKHFLS